MDRVLSNYADSRDNNFNLMRFIAAGMVMFSHCYPLIQGHEENEPLYQFVGLTLGDLAVDLFFITSGFLVAKSWLRIQSLSKFIRARVMRIYPGLVTALLICVFGFGLIFTSMDAMGYLTSKETWRYLLQNFSLLPKDLKYYLPGVFEGMPYESINGSLWTLPWEIRMYGLLALCGVLGGLIRLNFKWLVSVIGTIATVLYIANEHPSGHFNNHDFVEQGLRFLSFFFMGAMYYVFQDKISILHRVAIPMMLVCGGLVVLGDSAIFHVIYVLFLPYVLLYLAYIPKGFIRGFNSLGDYSYGLYIYAYPVQQSIKHVWPEVGTLVMFLIAFPITLALAACSWYWVEKPMLKRK